MEFPLTQMGVLAPGSTHARPSTQPPIDVSGNIPAHMSGVGGLKFSTVFLINFLAKSGKSKHFSCFFLFFLIINKNVGHFVCLASSKIVVTIFACLYSICVFHVWPINMYKQVIEHNYKMNFECGNANFLKNKIHRVIWRLKPFLTVLRF
jgi:hypothetical protein